MHPSGSGMMEAQWERAQFPSILDHSHKARWLRDLERRRPQRAARVTLSEKISMKLKKLFNLK